MNRLQELYDSGVVIVASAGQDANGPIGTLFDPANRNMVISVGGVSAIKEFYSIGTFGVNMEVTAPATDLIVRTKTNGTIIAEGTSFSGAFISGIIALGRNLAPTISVTQLRSLLHITVEDINLTGRDIYTGFGIVLADHFVRSITDTSDPVLIDYSLTILDTTGPVYLQLTFYLLEQSGIHHCSLFYKTATQTDDSWNEITPCTENTFPIYPINANQTIIIQVEIINQTSFLTFFAQFSDLQGHQFSTEILTVTTGLTDPEISDTITSYTSNPSQSSDPGHDTDSEQSDTQIITKSGRILSLTENRAITSLGAQTIFGLVMSFLAITLLSSIKVGNHRRRIKKK